MRRGLDWERVGEREFSAKEGRAKPVGKPWVSKVSLSGSQFEIGSESEGYKIYMELTYQILSWSVVLLTILAAFASGGAIITGKILDKRKEIQIAELQPRTLTDTQRSELLNIIAEQSGKIGFYSRLMDGESSDFADSLASVFAEAGWTVAPTIHTSLNDFPGFLSIFVTGENLGPTASFICESLQRIGMDCHPENIKDSSLGGVRELDTVYVVVGRKR